MTRLLERALEAARTLSPEEQDEIGRIILQLAGTGETEPVQLNESERAAVARSKAAAAAGEFASDEEVRELLARTRG